MNQSQQTTALRVRRASEIEATGDPAASADRYLIESQDSGGLVALVEHIVGPHVLAAPVHRHSREDEYSVVLEGRLGVLQDGEEVIATPGDIVFKPRGHWHTFWNAGDGQLRILEVIAPARPVMSSGATSPEELEGMLEDACLLIDESFLPILFDIDAVLMAPGPNQVRGRPAIANVIIKQLRDSGSYVAAPNLVLQSGPPALIISANATSVARRNLDGWHYVISRLDL